MKDEHDHKTGDLLLSPNARRQAASRARPSGRAAGADFRARENYSFPT